MIRPTAGYIPALVLATETCMLSRINRLIIVLLLMGMAVYIVVLNRETIAFRLSPGWVISLNIGVLFLGALSAGILTASLVGLYFGFKAYLRERRLVARDRQRQLFLDQSLEARSALASGEAGKARTQWEELSKRDPTGVISPIELSRCLEAQGRVEEALRVVDQVRASHPDNLEVLFRAAELNRALGNRTAALDNILLIAGKRATLRAARMGRELAEELGQFDQALRFHKQCAELGESSEDAEPHAARLAFKRAVSEHSADEVKLREELDGVLRRHPRLLPAVELLARLETDAGRPAEAAQAHVRAAKISTDSGHWREAARLWLKDGKPERALAAARSAVNGTSGATRIDAELFLIQIHLGLNQNEEAHRLLDHLPTLAQQEGISLSDDARRTFLAHRALCAQRLGKSSELMNALQKLSEGELVSSQPKRSSRLARELDGPSPSLSTP